jgi:cytochrome c553
MPGSRICYIALACCLTLAAPTPSSASDAERGAALFPFCTTCHGADGGGNRDYAAPSIAGLSAWYVEAQLTKFRNGQRGLHPDDANGLRMYPMSLHLKTDEEVRAVAEYIASLPPAAPAPELEGGDAAAGAAWYATCTACHGQDAQGMELLKGAPLSLSSDWYLLSSLRKFREGVRGAAAGDSSGAVMRPMAQILPDEQAMKDVIAHIMTLSK